MISESSAVSLTLLYNDPRVIIPAKAGIQIENTGFRIKSGMTKCVKLFLRHYTRLRRWFAAAERGRSKRLNFSSIFLWFSFSFPFRFSS
jgi:hypothetical protein